MSVELLHARRRRRRSRTRCATSASTRPYGKELPALPAPRHRPAPRRPAAQVPPAGREAGAAGAAQGGQRHRHAGRGRQHPDPHRAVHPALQVRRREERHPAACATSSRSPGAPAARASTTQGSVVAQAPEHVIENLRLAAKAAAPGKKVVHAEAAREGLRPLGQGHLRPAGRAARPSRWSRASRSPTACCSTCCRGSSGPGRGGGYRRLLELIAALARRATRASSAPARRGRRLLPRPCAHAGLIELVRDRGGARPPASRCTPALQRDFSLQPHAVAVPGRDAGAARPDERRPTRSTC